MQVSYGIGLTLLVAFYDTQGIRQPHSKPRLQDKTQQKKKKKDDPEDRISNELKKVALLQARTAKRGSKQKRLNSCVDPATPQAKQGIKRKKSNFTDELTNTSKGNAKKMRYNGKAEKKFSKKGLKTNKKNVGKAFGKPQQKKARR